MKSAPRLLRRACRVRLDSEFVSGIPRSGFVRDTLSPGIRRSLPPAANSVARISDSAVESHAVSGRPDAFWNPRMATVRRPAEWRRTAYILGCEALCVVHAEYASAPRG